MVLRHSPTGATDKEQTKQLRKAQQSASIKAFRHTCAREGTRSVTCAHASCACVCAHAHTRTHTRAHTHTHTRTHPHTRARTHAQIHTQHTPINSLPYWHGTLPPSSVHAPRSWRHNAGATACMRETPGKEVTARPLQ